MSPAPRATEAVFAALAAGRAASAVATAAAGARASYRVDYASELEEPWFEGATTVGVTSGASVPDDLVHEVLDWLSSRGFVDVEEVSAAEEKLVFSLPPELRRDMKSAATP